MGGWQTDPPGLAARLAKMFQNYERAHLVGPGFGGELAEGIMHAPTELNQEWQNRIVEGFLRNQAEAGRSVDVTVTATGQRLAIPLANGTFRHVDVLTSVTYVVHGADGTARAVTFAVEMPPSG
jgi:hypothetical protein